AEAPSQCDSANDCQPLALANFGTLQFSGATVTTAHGHRGTISDPAWRTSAIKLDGSGQQFGHHRFFMSPVSGATAPPSALSSLGDAFTVTFSQPDSQGTGSAGSGSGSGGSTGTGSGSSGGNSSSSSSGTGSSGTSTTGSDGSGDGSDGCYGDGSYG